MLLQHLLKFMLHYYFNADFEIVSATKSDESLYLHLEQKAEHLSELEAAKLVSRRFLDQVTIQAFPLPGKFVYLRIKHRRWRNKTAAEIVKRDWLVAAKGTNMTQEFADF
jgi:hypothetical protein